MDQIHRYSTANAGSHAHVDYWNSVLRDLLIPLKVTSTGPGDFEAELELFQFGSTMLANICSSPARVDHDDRHIQQTDSRFFSLILCVEGTLDFRTGSKEMTLAEGDLVLYDSHAPSRLRFDVRHRALSMRIEPRSLATYVPNPEQFLGIPIRHEHHLGKVVGEMLVGIWEQVRRGLPADFENPLRRALLQVLASYLALEHGARVIGSNKLEIRRAAIKRHIEAHLTDPTLSVGSIGKAIKVSPRHVFRVFAEDEESLNAYIQRRRLEQSGYYLSSPLWSHWTITEVALHWGFTSVPHFSRLFKHRYSATPGEFRRRQLSARQAPA